MSGRSGASAILALSFLFVVSVAQAQSLSGVDWGWMDDFNDDGLDDIHLSPMAIVPLVPAGIIPVASGQGFVFCSNGGSGYELCYEGRLHGAPQFKVVKGDIDGDGSLDVLLIPKKEGGDSFMVLDEATGPRVAGIIEDSLLENGDSLIKKNVSLVDTNLDGTADIVIGGSIQSDQVVVLLDNKQGSIEPRKVLPLDLAQSSIADVEIKPPSYPRELPVSYAVSDLGQLSLEIPFDLPARGKSLKPQISLRYSPGASDFSTAGAGWVLSGIPRVQRCRASYAYDGFSGGYAFTEVAGSYQKERYCGRNGRLAATSSRSGHARMSYINGSEGWFDKGVPNSEMTPDGAGYDYDAVSSAVNGSHEFETVIWGASSLVSRNGEVASIAYKSGANSPIPASIMYDNVEVRFGYIPFRSYVSELGASKVYSVINGVLSLRGVKVSANGGDVLSSVDVYIDGVVRRKYVLDYTVHSQTRELVLKAVQECAYSAAAQEECGVPVRLSYLGMGKALGFSHDNSYAGFDGVEYLREADWEGNGRGGVVTVTSTASGGSDVAFMDFESEVSGGGFGTVSSLFTEDTQIHSVAAADVDDDGSSELIYLREPAAAVNHTFYVTATNVTNKSWQCNPVIVAGSGISSSSCSYRCPSGSSLKSDGMCYSTVSGNVTLPVRKTKWVIARHDTSSQGGVSKSEFSQVCYLDSDFSEAKQNLALFKPTVVDWNGDGFQDVVVLNQPCGQEPMWRIHYGSATGLGSGEDFLTAQGASYAGLGDINGDGKPDILTIEPAEADEGEERGLWRALIEVHDGSMKEVILSSNATSHGGDPELLENIPAENTIPVDINADGRVDFLSAQLDDSSGEWKWYLYKNNGSYFETKQELGLAPEGLPAGIDRKSGESYDVRPIFYDGDRFPDVLAPSRSRHGFLSIYVTRFNASGQPLLEEQVLAIAEPDKPEDIRIADYNQDGIQDIAILDRTSGELDVHTLDRPFASAVSGMTFDWPDYEKSVDFDYERIAQDSPVYTYEAGSAGRNRVLPAGPYVVASITVDDKADSSYEVNYHYKSLVRNAEGLGYLGFLEVSKENSATALKEISTFSEGNVAPDIAFLPTKLVVESTETGQNNKVLERETSYIKKARALCADGSTAIIEIGATSPCPTPSSSKLFNRFVYHFRPSVVREASYLRGSTDPVSVKRSVFSYDDRGTRTGVMTQTGTGVPSGDCASLSTCLPLGLVIHEQDSSSIAEYADYAYENERAYGPFFNGISQQAVQSSWSLSPIAQGSGLQGGYYGQALSSLLADVGYQMHVTEFRGYASTRDSAELPFLEPSIVQLMVGTSRARQVETQAIYKGYESIKKTKALLPAAMLVTENGTSRDVTEQYVYSDLAKYKISEIKVAHGTTTMRQYLSNYDEYYWQPLTTSDQNGFETTLELDAFGQAASETYPDGSSKSINIDFCYGACPAYAAGAIYYQHTSGIGDESTAYYNLRGEVVATRSRTMSGSWSVQTFTYDDQGRPLAQSVPYLSPCTGTCAAPGATLYSYDDAHETVTQTRPDGGTLTTNSVARAGGGVVTYRTEQVSDACIVSGGSLACNTAPIISWKTETDVMGNVVRKVENLGDAEEIQTEYLYDPAGRMVLSRVNGDDSTVVIRKYDLDGNLTDEYDPDRGHAHYEWSVLNELLTETHTGLDGTTLRSYTYYYDGFGRNVKRRHDQSGKSVVYDYTLFNRLTCRIGMLCGISASDGSVSETYTYQLQSDVPGTGLPLTRTLVIDPPGATASRSFQFQYDYLSGGLADTITYPDDTVIKHRYQNDWLQVIENDATDEVYWTALSYDAFGSPDQVLLGNGVQVDRASDPATGLLASSLAYLPSAPYNRVQASSFSYDSRGRMTSRTVDDQQPDTLFPQKVLRHRVEQFAHDAWNRVQRGEVTDLLAGPSPVASEAYAYSALGNITQFPGQGSYAYSEYTYATGECVGALTDPGPHAVRKVGAVQHCYNAFGEMVSAGTRTYGWDGDNTAPVSIIDGSSSASFLYGPEGAKRFMLASGGTTTAERWFAGEGFELDVTPSETIERLTLGDFAVLESNGTTASIRYTLRDHLGSVEVILDDDATDGLSIYDSVIRQQSFAPFGARRDSDWVGAYADTPVLDDGYTGHQMLDQFDLIHMNGRVYDPAIGRFLSPDIVIQAPYFSQSYNRYSYVMNGPMQFVDPSGYLSELSDIWVQTCIPECLGSGHAGVDMGSGYVMGGGQINGTAFLPSSGPAAGTALGNDALERSITASANAAFGADVFNLAYELQKDVDLNNLRLNGIGSTGLLWAGSGANPMDFYAAIGEANAPLTRIESSSLVLAAGAGAFGGGAALGWLSSGSVLSTLTATQLEIMAVHQAIDSGGPVVLGPLGTGGVNATTRSGLGITAHSVSQKINRHVRSIDELDALRNPLLVGPVKIDSLGRPSQRYVGRKAEVAINPETGKIVSVNPTSSRKAERLLRQQGGSQ